MSYRQVLREFAFDTHGVITTRDAEALGVPPAELRKLAHRGALGHLAHGVYRMLEVPPTPLDEFAQAVAMVGEDAVLADEAVLAARDLADINLRRIRVATMRRVRAQLPATVEVVHRAVPDADREYLDGVPSMTIEAALRGARGRVMVERLIDAAHTARARGLIGPDQEARVITELASTA